MKDFLSVSETKYIKRRLAQKVKSFLNKFSVIGVKLEAEYTITSKTTLALSSGENFCVSYLKHPYAQTKPGLRIPKKISKS